MAVYKFTNISGKRRSFSTPVNRVLNINEAVTLDVSTVDFGSDISAEVNAGFLLSERLGDVTPDNMEIAVVSMIPEGSGGGGSAVGAYFPSYSPILLPENYTEETTLQVTLPEGMWAVDVMFTIGNAGGFQVTQNVQGSIAPFSVYAWTWSDEFGGDTGAFDNNGIVSPPGFTQGNTLTGQGKQLVGVTAGNTVIFSIRVSNPGVVDDYEDTLNGGYILATKIGAPPVYNPV